jgi:SAM-dependent methyltransferase
MIEILSYILIAILSAISLFFFLRTIVVAVSMLTEVPYLPSNKTYKEAIGYLNIDEGDKVIDIGCGDGRVLRYAAKKYPEAQFVGIDRNFLLITYAKFLNILFRRENLVFIKANAHDFNLREYDKVYLYLLPKIVDSILLEKRDELKKGCEVVSFHYGFSEKFFGINNTIKYPVKYRNKQDYIYKWINK